MASNMEGAETSGRNGSLTSFNCISLAIAGLAVNGLVRSIACQNGIKRTTAVTAGKATSMPDLNVQYI